MKSYNFQPVNVQQPTDSEKPWYKKGSMLLLILSSLILIISLTSLYNQTDDLSDILDPRINNVAEVKSGESTDISLYKNKHYAAYSLEGADVKSENLHLININSQLEISSTDGLMFSDRQGSDGMILPALKWWVLSEDINASLVNEGNATIWLIDYGSAESEMMSRGELMLSMGGCMLSICLIPFASILLFMGRKKKNNQNVMFTNNPNINTQQNIGLNNFSSIQNNNMNILSTDQIFALTHGDENMKEEVLKSISSEGGFGVKKEEENVPPPFVNVKKSQTIEKIKPKTKNDSINETTEISSTNWKDWDEG